ncbi:MAG: hypothetical protein R3F43_01065 [bacterium]
MGAAVEADLRFIRLELPGFGETPRRRSVARALVETVVRTLDAGPGPGGACSPLLQLGPGGQRRGGAPTRVAGVALIAPAGVRPHRGRHRYRGDVAGTNGHAGPGPRRAAAGQGLFQKAGFRCSPAEVRRPSPSWRGGASPETRPLRRGRCAVPSSPRGPTTTPPSEPAVVEELLALVPTGWLRCRGQPAEEPGDRGSPKPSSVDTDGSFMSQNGELPLTEAELARALDELRLHGGTVTIEARAATTSLGFGTSGWYLAHFDEGAEEVQPTSEETVRRYAASDPQVFRGLLPEPRLRLSAAWQAGDRAGGAHLGRGRRRSATAWAGWRCWRPTGAHRDDGAQAALIRKLADDRTAWHAFMGPVARGRTPATGELGLAFARHPRRPCRRVKLSSSGRLPPARRHDQRADGPGGRSRRAPGGPSARRPGAGAAGGGFRAEHKAPIRAQFFTPVDPRMKTLSVPGRMSIERADLPVRLVSAGLPATAAA